MPLTLQALLRHYWHRFRDGVRQKAVIKCPKCAQPVPVDTPTCPACQTTITVAAAVDATMERPRRRWRLFINQATPATDRKIRALYLLLSVALLWGVLAYTESHLSERWFSHAILALGYLVFLTLLASLILPGPWLNALLKRTKVLTKLGLLCNYLTLPVLLHMLVGAWWQRAVSLAVVITGTALALIVLRVILSLITPSPTQNQFDITARQGRRGRFD